MKFIDKLGQMAALAAEQIGQELGRMGVQGTAEIGSAIFTGSAYVPYGQGQNRPSGVHGMEGLHANGKEEPQHENDGRSM